VLLCTFVLSILFVNQFWECIKCFTDGYCGENSVFWWFSIVEAFKGVLCEVCECGGGVV